MRSFFRRLSNKKGCSISLIVVAYNMAREIPRTLRSLQRDYQKSAEHIDYEVIVVDNGSKQPLSNNAIAQFGPQFRLLRIDNASASPVKAINQAAAMARGDYLGIIIDGARMLSPGILYWATQAFSLSPRAVVSVLGFHLGPSHQRLSSANGYNQHIEDTLLDSIAWQEDGYRLFDIASLAGSSKFGWMEPLAESNCLFVSRALYREVGGFDEGFTSPGGGLANLDFYKRCCDAKGITLYHLLGEGCFHQIHGGVTTGGAGAATRYEALTAEYESIRGYAHSIPKNIPVLLGKAQPNSIWLMADGSSAQVKSKDLEECRNRLFATVGL